MGSTFGSLELSKRALFAQQIALHTTGHNIANANTPGFTRQTVNFVAARPLEALGLMRSTVPGQIGQSVEVTSITRIRERFLDNQYYNENKDLGQWSVRRDTLEKLEAIVNEPSETGLRQVMDNFWNAWQELSKQPDNIEARAVVRESANALADAFNSVSKKLNDLSADLDDTMSVKTRQIQTLIDQIARLNAEIYRVEALTNNANDLRDQRDLLLDNLSKIVNIAVTEEANGYYVRMGNVELVRGANSAQVTLESLRNAMATGDLNSGEMYGLFYSKDTHVKQLQDELNTMIRTLVNAVNELHHTGYTLKHPVTTGGDFFIIGDPTQPALTVRVNPTMTDEDIAASRRTYTDATGEVRVVRGDNELALLMAGLRSHKFNFSGAGNNVGLSDGTLDEFYRAMVSKLGVQGEEAIRQSDNQRVLVDQIDSRRQSVSGVSLDEEMVNMIRFQHAYNAAARAMTTYDEVLDRIINGMGRVGL